MKRYLVDARDLGHNTKGITRVLTNLIPRVVQMSADEVVVVCTAEGTDLLDESSAKRALIVPSHLQSKWEQWDLPRLGATLEVAAIYGHRECGPLWGPPFVLHVPEDPEVRWKRNPPASLRDQARRSYSRLLMRHALHRVEIVAASTPSVARGLAERYRVPKESISLVPLGVDLEMFRPSAKPAADAVFHLGSSDPRDRTVMVVEAWAAARESMPSLAKLVIGGRLGAVESAVRRRAAALRVDVDLTGYLRDDELASRYREAAVVVQPSSDEGFGLQPLEAMASGSPLVVTKTDAVLDVVKDAAIVREAVARDLAAGILLALEREDSLRARARQHAETYSWDSTAAAVLSCLANAAAAPRRSH